jgi:hypothetical protein
MKKIDTLIAFRVPSWMEKDIMGEVKNKSGRIKELMIKGHLYEKQQESNNKNGRTGIQSWDLNRFGRFAVSV